MGNLTGKTALIPLLFREPVRHHHQNFHQLPNDERKTRLKVNPLFRNIYGFECLSAPGPGIMNADGNVQLEAARNSTLGYSHGVLLTPVKGEAGRYS
jgi:hypothetical protein